MHLASFSAPLLAASLVLGCSAPDDILPDGAPPIAVPTALARCADPARPIAPAWEVDNIRAPLLALTQLDSTIVVTSGDGAVKTWTFAGGTTPTTPSYGTAFIDDGDVVAALASVAGTTPGIAALDGRGRTHLWSPTGTELRAPLQLTPLDVAGSYVAVDDELRWIAGGTTAQGGGLAVADLETGAIQGPLETAMWNVTDATIGHGGVLVTVGHMYGSPAIEVRDPRDPTAVVAYWDGYGDQINGWLRAVALNPDATEAIAVGDGWFMKFDLATIASGPVTAVETAEQFVDVEWSFADQVALTLGPGVVGSSTISVWSTADATMRRTTTVPEAIGLGVHPGSGLIVTARADGMVRGDHCSD